MRTQSFNLALSAALLICLAAPSSAADRAPPADQSGSSPGTMMMTILLKHDQSMTVDEINARLRRQGFYEAFPPKGVEVVSWYVMMGIGQVVTLRFPAERLREVNRSIEATAWGPYHTEFYPTYDFRPVAAEQRKTP